MLLMPHTAIVSMAAAKLTTTAIDSTALRTVHSSALCLVPPVALWEALAPIRERFDKGYLRWLPHINVAYPFVERDRFDDVVPVLAAALTSVPAFSITLDQAGFFTHTRSATVWLHTTDPSAQAVRQLWNVAGFAKGGLGNCRAATCTSTFVSSVLSTAVDGLSTARCPERIAIVL